MASHSNKVLLLLLPFLCIQLTHLHCSVGDDSTSAIRCLETERKALVEFKKGLRDPTNRLSSWVGDDCCSWDGVRCDNRSGHIVRLNLRNGQPFPELDAWIYLDYGDALIYNTTGCFSGEINPSLLGLPHLNYLDLSGNCFIEIQIPKFMGSLRELRYLNLSGAGFSGAVPHELGNLSNLHSLDLSSIGYYFGSSDYAFYPETILNVDSLQWLPRLTSLQYLAMSYTNLSKVSSDWVQALNALPSLRRIHLRSCELGTIPLSLPQLNLTSLTLLDLSHNYFISTIPLWLFNISGLEYLDLRGNSFHGLISSTLGDTFPFLKVLDLSDNEDLRLSNISNTLDNLCKLQKLSLSYINMSQQLSELGGIFSRCMADNLESLELRSCGVTNYILESLENLKKLKYLDLNFNWLSGSFPMISLGNLKELKYLDLRYNSLSGSLPMSLEKLSSLQELHLGANEFNGTIPKSLWQLPDLFSLDLSDNTLTGTVFEENLSALTKLEYLFLNDNSLVLKVSTNWVPPFQLKLLDMASCNLGPQFPAWLKTQVKLFHIDLSYAGISGTIPPWFWNLTSKITFLDLSFNKLSGRLPQSLMFASDSQERNVFAVLDLSSNLFDGPVPQFISERITILDLSNNSLTGPLPLSTWPVSLEVSLSMNKINGSIPSSFYKMKSLESLDLSNNQLSGHITSSFCKMKGLHILNFSKNQLSGHIPGCWSGFSNIWVIDFSNNNLTGGIPKSLGSLPSLLMLHLRNNSLTGELPTSLQSCLQMQVLDLGQNKLEGNIPGWIGETLSKLIILRLDSNMFHGHIPQKLSHLNHLHYLDLSTNNLSGTIPATFANFNAMRNVSLGEITSPEEGYDEDDLVLTKGSELEYKKQWLVSLLRIIDLSNNHLFGNIPKELADLSLLQSLNLSRNLLTGQIIEEIGELQQLFSLDLSRNKLSGAIPPSLSHLTFLESLNLSYNNLSGRIPTGNQLQTFIDPSIYAGNINLCGFPLPKICQDDESPATPRISSDGNVEDENDDEAWLYSGIGPGIAVGLCTVLGLLLAKRTWRHEYFQFTDTAYDRLYVVIIVNFARLRRKLQIREQGHSPTL